ncbi:MAG: hypothetical protein Q7T50_02795 [Candidatus Magasanikbacteria bacterium]|nr:hypothetical protein [Candidatus Magasanikbacteria bacterium]
MNTGVIIQARGCSFSVGSKKDTKKKRKKRPLTKTEQMEIYTIRTSKIPLLQGKIGSFGKNSDEQLATIFLEGFISFLILGKRSSKIVMPISRCMIKQRIVKDEPPPSTKRLKGPALIVNQILEELGYKTIIVPRTITSKNIGKLKLLCLLPSAKKVRRKKCQNLKKL